LPGWVVLGWLAKSFVEFGFATELWTAPRVAKLIDEHFAVAYHPCRAPRMERFSTGRWSTTITPPLTLNFQTFGAPQFLAARSIITNVIHRCRS
jgi:hypothetical protein